MRWYRWSSQSSFDVWHQQVIADLGLPRVGVNAKTGEPQPDKQATTAYTSVVRAGLRDWRAPVEQEIAERFADGLGVPSEPPADVDVL